MSGIYYHCHACQHEWLGDLECPKCGNRELKGPQRIDGGGEPADVVEAATLVAFDAVCKCSDVHGDNPFCPACIGGEA